MYGCRIKIVKKGILSRVLKITFQEGANQGIIQCLCANKLLRQAVITNTICLKPHFKLSFFVFNWFNRQQCQSFSKSVHVSAISAMVVEILKYCMLFFRC